MAPILAVCQLSLSVILLVAGTGKVLKADQFFAVLRLSRLPEALVVPAGMLTPIVELCLCIALLLSPEHLLPLTMGMAFALFSLFTAWVYSVYSRGLRLRCGCFGAGGAEIGLHTLQRNLVLIVLSLGGALIALHTRSLLPDPSPWMAMCVISSATCLMLIYAFRQARSAIALTLADRERLEQEQQRSHVESEAIA